MSDDKKKKLAFAICEYLQQSIQNGAIKADDAEGIEVAVQCIGEAFGVDPTDDEHQKQYSIKPANLLSIFDVYLATQKKVKSEGKADGLGKSDELDQKQIAERKAKAEELKGQGNKAIGAKNYPEAVKLYTQAIELDSENPLYYGNRAAAYSQTGEHQKAVDDALKSVELDSNYGKGYSRLGHAYFCLAKYEEAIEAFEKGLRLDPNNAVLKQSLKRAQDKWKEVGGSAESDRSVAGNDAGADGGAGAGGFDFASMMNNPNFMNMASQMMNNPAISSMLQNPAIAQMAQNMMRDPSALQNMMNNPALARAMQGMQNNDE
ncbi:hypothetical protein HDV00_007082 [Rhizophlyctis rosea]|nr:hypothetical protein HDV00_007082 [Rhizophlyctis rosea]